ncbi:hypothetical protein GCM10027422_11130 [Hymenobacter arcticus]
MLLLYLSEKLIAQTYQRISASAHDWQRLEPVLLAHVRRRSKWPLLELVNAILYVQTAVYGAMC